MEIYKFFIICPPDLEHVLVKEIQTKYTQYFDSNFELIKKVGGVELSCPLTNGLKLNYILRSPTRILLRIDEFKCKDTPKLFNKIYKFNWRPYLNSIDFKINSSSHQSRLFDDRKIEKAATDAIIKFINDNPLKKKHIDEYNHFKNKNNIYIRLEEDLLTLSIDLTGERLNIRGDKIMTGHAPIRENLAYSLISELTMGLDISKYNLIDPMCGSGTFLKEAFDFYNTNNRDFSFLHFPLWDKSLEKEINNFQKVKSFNSIKGFEIDKDVLEMCRLNLSKYPEIELSLESLFSENIYSQVNNLVILNPPYGKRVKTEQVINDQYYQKIIEYIEEKFSPKRIGIIVPTDYKLIFNEKYKRINKIKFKNGGIPVNYFILEHT